MRPICSIVLISISLSACWEDEPTIPTEKPANGVTSSDTDDDSSAPADTDAPDTSDPSGTDSVVDPPVDYSCLAKGWVMCSAEPNQCMGSTFTAWCSIQGSTFHCVDMETNEVIDFNLDNVDKREDCNGWAGTVQGYVFAGGLGTDDVPGPAMAR